MTGELWRDMTDEDKEPFVALAMEDKTRAAREVSILFQYFVVSLIYCIAYILISCKRLLNDRWRIISS